MLSALERRVLRGVAGRQCSRFGAQRLAAEAIKARRRAEATELRSALLSAVGHDLRTPLTAIKAAAGWPARSRPGAVGRRRGHPAGDHRGMRGPVAGAGGRPAGLGPVGRRGVEPQLRHGLRQILTALATVDAGHLVTDQADAATPPVLADPGLLERVVANMIARHAHPRPRPRRRSPAPPSTVTRCSCGSRPWTRPPQGPDRGDVRTVPATRDRNVPASGVGLGLAVSHGFTEAIGGALRRADPRPRTSPW